MGGNSTILAALWATGNTAAYFSRLAELSLIDEKFSGHGYPKSRLLEKVLVALLVVNGVMGMLHPQFIIDYPMHIKKIVKRLDEIRTGAFKPGRTAWIDPTKILKAHDAAASLLLTALLGTVQNYTLGMSLLDATSDGLAALQDLKNDLLGPLAIDGVASLAYLKNIDLARYFTRFAELGAPVPRHLLATLCAEVARLTGAAVSSEVVSSWGAVPLPLAAGAGADTSAKTGVQKHTTDPKAGRLVLFKARTVMHEVLPTHRKRFALTLWYFDGGER